MLQRTLGSGWGVLLPGLLIAGLMYADLSPDQWRIIILMGLVLTPVMLYHKQLRHYVLLPSCLAHHADDNEFEAGMIKQGRNKKGSKDNWCEGGDLNPHVRKDTNT